MQCHTQPNPLVLEQFEAPTWTSPQRLRSHFELLRICSGRGEYTVNGQHAAYCAGHLFLLGPADTYSFASQETTRFGVLTFTEDYLTTLTAAGMHTGAWQQLLHAMLHASPEQRARIALHPTEQQQLDALLAMLGTAATTHKNPFNDTLAESLLGAVLSLVGRRLAGAVPPPRRSAPSYVEGFVQRLLAYIRRHISEPDHLRVERLAEEFAYSPSHLSALFKQATGESLRQYIVRYKLKLVEARLQLSTLTVSQIADELAFTDVCHLNKLFKKHYHATPTDYRRHLGAAVSASR